jgi:hypothetical protein
MDKVPPQPKPPLDVERWSRVTPETIADLLKEVTEVNPVLASLLIARPIEPTRRARRGSRGR